MTQRLFFSDIQFRQLILCALTKCGFGTSAVTGSNSQVHRDFKYSPTTFGWLVTVLRYPLLVIGKFDEASYPLVSLTVLHVLNVFYCTRMDKILDVKFPLVSEN